MTFSVGKLLFVDTSNDFHLDLSNKNGALKYLMHYFYYS